MSVWRRKALQLLPNYRPIIEAADRPMVLWIDLWTEFCRVCKDHPDDLKSLSAFFDYARWCLTQTNGHTLSDVGTAAFCAFYEHLPGNPVARQHLQNWISLEEFNNLEGAWRYFLDDAAYEVFRADFMTRAQRENVMRPSTGRRKR